MFKPGSLFQESQRHFVPRLPPLSVVCGVEGDPRFSVLLVDEFLLRANPEVRRWSKAFPVVLPLRAGESLKTLSSFSRVAESLVKICGDFPRSSTTVVALGGGSVGDFSGFLASTFQRGVNLVQIPSTWLSAMDSAHGGKTGLNVAGIKNQFGTFYSATRIFLVRSILFSQPEKRVQEALGELAKIALLDPKVWAAARRIRRPIQGPDLWRLLPEAIAAKWRVVRKDPFERGSLRRRLNLGHTWGHVLEAALKIPHGTAVGEGLFFSLSVSRRMGWLPEVTRKRAGEVLASRFGLRRGQTQRQALPKIPARKARELLLRDKKKSPGSVKELNFVGIKRPGLPTEGKISVDDLLQWALEEGYLK